VKDHGDPDKKRLFLAVNLSVPTTRKIAETVDRLRGRTQGTGLRVAWVPATQLHVTLKFLGWARSEVVEGIRDVVTASTQVQKGFEIGARGLGVFPSESAPRILWVGVEDPSGSLAQLARQIEAAMETLGFAKETRAFSPHVTIGRVKEGDEGSALLSSAGQADFGSSLVREVVLYESKMKSSGSEYIPLARMPLSVPPYRVERHTREVERGSTESEEPDGGQST
jgi:2'-5' RNA ligase